MAKATKKLNTKLCIVIALFLVLAIIISVCAIIFKNNHTGFDPEKVAISFTETIVNRGDGYNAYEKTLLTKNHKYDEYIRENYIYPIIYAESNYQKGMDTSNLKGLNDKSYISEKTKNDDGTLANEVITRMYPFYIQLITELNGWDRYNTFYTRYFAELVKVREEVFGDKYITDEIMFTVLEANVSAYGDKLVGTQDVAHENSNAQLNEKPAGVYENKYGENCVFTYEVTETKNIALEEYKPHVDEGTFKTYGISLDDIKEVKAVTIQIKAGELVVVDAQKILVVKTGSQWCVDNTNTNTTALYNFYK